MTTLSLDRQAYFDRADRVAAGLWIAPTLFAITVIGAAVRIGFLDHPIRYDEALNYLWFSSRSPGYVLSHYNPNNHVLHTFLVRFTTALFGAEPFALRLPTFIGGVLLIPLSAWMSWSLFRSKWGALVTAVAIAVSSQLIEYSANSRGYLWLSVFTTAAIIIVVHAIASPARLRLWLLWGVVSALGAYTLPLMIYPFAGMVVAILLTAFFRSAAGERRAMIRGAVIGSAVCGLLTFGLYAPILLTQGVAETWKTREMTYVIWGPRVGSFGSMLSGVWDEWIRDTAPVWRWGLTAGGIAYLVTALRHPIGTRLIPLIVIAVVLCIIAAQGAPLRSRAWMFVLPMFLASAVEGLRTLRPAPLPHHGPAITALATCILLVAATVSLDTVRRRKYLCSEPNVMVDIESVIDEAAALGPDRCALIMRYSPAVFYYRTQKDLPEFPAASSPAAEHVLIVSEDIRPLTEQWHPGINGFDLYRSPVVHKLLDRCTIFRADRIPPSPLAQTKPPNLPSQLGSAMKHD